VSSITSSRYGSVLVVGGNASSGLQSTPLYESVDVGHHFGCATKRSGLTTSAHKESVTCNWTGGRCSRTSVSTIAGVLRRRVRRLPVTDAKLLGRFFHLASRSPTPVIRCTCLTPRHNRSFPSGESHGDREAAPAVARVLGLGLGPAPRALSPSVATLEVKRCPVE